MSNSIIPAVYYIVCSHSLLQAKPACVYIHHVEKGLNLRNRSQTLLPVIISSVFMAEKTDGDDSGKRKTDTSTNGNLLYLQ